MGSKLYLECSARLIIHGLSCSIHSQLIKKKSQDVSLFSYALVKTSADAMTCVCTCA
jgi:hypothetical protein